MKKRILMVLVLFLGGSLITFGYYAQFLFNVDAISVSLGSLQSTTTPITLSFERFTGSETGGPASYKITRFSVCEEYDANGDCVKNYPDLCPYISLLPQIPSIEKVGFSLNPFDATTVATGELDIPNTISDSWNLGIHSPCFEGECPSGYDESARGTPLPQVLKGSEFVCELDSWSNDPVYPVWNIFAKPLFASTPSQSLRVSAILTGDVTPSLPTCCSSVAFIPGLQATRLAKQGVFFEDQLWEPNRNADVKDMYLDTTGKSLDPSIYTKGVVDEVNIAGTDIYKSFIQDMDNLVQNNIVSSWKPLPYDWRLSLADIVDNGALQKDGSREDMVAEIEKLSGSSKTGKVSIVTHSNGGLVAKALIQKLEAQGKAGLIDKLILVAVPQVGTPQSIPDMLHGSNILAGLIMSNETARGLSLNMPGAYQLLPSQKYFATVASPVIRFDQSLQGFNNFIAQFGNQITNYATLKRFLLDTTDNRTAIPSDNIEKNLTQNPNLIRDADTIHASIDNYVIPSNIEVSQIAGWGINTVSGIEYYKKQKPTCVGTVCSVGFTLDYRPMFTMDGDKTVITKSATNINSNTNYFNLYLFNSETSQTVDHVTLLNSQPIRSTVGNLIQNSTSTAQYISTTIPTLSNLGISKRISVHSPVSIELNDNQGRRTGLVPNPDPASDLRVYEEKIPNSYYLELGEGKYVGYGGGAPTTVKLQGTGIGTFTLIIDELVGGVVTKSTSYSDIPVMKGTKAELILATTTTTALKVDQNGDGINDFSVVSSQKFDSVRYLLSLKSVVRGFSVDSRKKAELLVKIDVTILGIKLKAIKNPEQKISNFLGSLEGGDAQVVGFTPNNMNRMLDYILGIQIKK